MHIIASYIALPAPHPMRWWSTIVETLALWRQRSRSRRHLAELDDRGLADIGLSRTGRRIECRKRFWQA